MPRGGWLKNIKTVMILLLVGVGFFCWQKSESRAISTDVVINEIMVGKDGATKYEFIELYNNSDDDIDLAGYSLKKKTQSGTESNLVSKTKFIGTILAHSYFLISHPDYIDEFDSDLVYSGTSYSIAMNNTVLLYDTEDNLVDKVGYGEASDFEESLALEFVAGQSIERVDTGIDTDNNNTDFVIRNIPSPGSDSSEAECGNGIIETGEECDDSNIINGDGCNESSLIAVDKEPGE